MRGMNARTGRAITDMDHIRQSCQDILTTPIGTRVMNREYGSLLPDLIDQPLNGATLLRAYAATVMALAQWEPRIRIERIVRLVNSQQQGTATIEIEGVRLDTGSTESFTLNLSNGSA